MDELLCSLAHRRDFELCHRLRGFVPYSPRGRRNKFPAFAPYPPLSQNDFDQRLAKMFVVDAIIDNAFPLFAFLLDGYLCEHRCRKRLENMCSFVAGSKCQWKYIDLLVLFCILDLDLRDERCRWVRIYRNDFSKGCGFHRSGFSAEPTLFPQVLGQSRFHRRARFAREHGRPASSNFQL